MDGFHLILCALFQLRFGKHFLQFRHHALIDIRGLGHLCVSSGKGRRAFDGLVFASCRFVTLVEVAKEGVVANGWGTPAHKDIKVQGGYLVPLASVGQEAVEVSDGAVDGEGLVAAAIEESHSGEDVGIPVGFRHGLVESDSANIVGRTVMEVAGGKRAPSRLCRPAVPPVLHYRVVPARHQCRVSHHHLFQLRGSLKCLDKNTLVLLAPLLCLYQQFKAFAVVLLCCLLLLKRPPGFRDTLHKGVVELHHFNEEFLHTFGVALQPEQIRHVLFCGEQRPFDGFGLACTFGQLAAGTQTEFLDLAPYPAHTAVHPVEQTFGMFHEFVVLMSIDFIEILCVVKQMFFLLAQFRVLFLDVKPYVLDCVLVKPLFVYGIQQLLHVKRIDVAHYALHYLKEGVAYLV